VEDSLTNHAAIVSRRLASLRDPAMRLAWAGDLLRKMVAERAVGLLAASLGTPGRHPDQDDLFLTLTLALVQEELDAVRRALGSHAARHGPTEIAWLFARRPDSVPPLGTLPVPDHGRDRPLTLGERKSLARGRDRKLLLRAIRDPHPDVAAILLANPTLTETDVRRMASRRPIDPAVLRQILAQPRWAVRYGVRLALVQNPHLPLDQALPLTALLRRRDARTLAAAPDLRAPLREVADWVATPATRH